jgi:glycosyltransferase involved in cell wall biosynthesis
MPSEIYKPDRLRILFIPRDNTGCGFYRMMVPANELKKQDMADVRLRYEWSWEDISWAHIIIIQRQSEPQAFEAIEQAQSMGKKIVYEIDDLLQCVDPNNPAFSYWTPSGANLSRALNIIRKCDAVQVSTKRLRNEYALWNRTIDVLPNYLDKSLWGTDDWSDTDWKDFNERANDDIIRIAWSGAHSHYYDLQVIEQIITKICRKYPNVHFCLIGYWGESKTGPNLFQELIPSTTKCSHCNNTGQLEKIPGTDLLYYPKKLRQSAFDVAVAPLIETGFNEAKSDVKIKEYAALGLPVIASAVGPYRESVQHGYTGFLASTGKEWFDAMEELIKNKDLRLTLGKNNHEWYRKNTIDIHIQKWLEFYYRIVSFQRMW